MTVTVPALGPHLDAVLAVLETVGQLGVYPGAGPSSPHDAAPYVVVYPYTPTYDGPTADIHADVDYRVLFRFVGTSLAQATDAADRGRAAMLDPDAALAPAGRVMRGPVQAEALRPTQRDDEPRTTTPLWITDEVYVVPTTPG